MITSSRSSSDRVAEWRMRSIASFTLDFLLDVGVGARDIGFGLVIVVVADEIFDRVVGEEALELAVELGGEDLVRRDDQRRPLQGLDDLGHGEGLAGAGDAEEHLARLAVLCDAFDQFADRRRLVAGRLVVGDDLEALAALRLLRAARACAARSPLFQALPAWCGFELPSLPIWSAAMDRTTEASCWLAGARSAGASNITIPRRRAVGTWEGAYPSDLPPNASPHLRERRACHRRLQPRRCSRLD